MKYFFALVWILVIILSIKYMFGEPKNYLPPLVFLVLGVVNFYKTMTNSKSKSEKNKVAVTSPKGNRSTEKNAQLITKHSKTTKNCATCNFWQGERELINSDMTVKIHSQKAKGKCHVEKKLSLPVRPYYTTCPKYQRWMMFK